MSFLIPTLLTTGPDIPYDIASFTLTLPTPTSLVFQILLVVRTAKISVKDLKQSLANMATSRKNW
jgi:hypothetical protein